MHKRIFLANAHFITEALACLLPFCLSIFVEFCRNVLIVKLWDFVLPFFQEVTHMSDKSTITEDSLELSKMFHEIKNPLTLINSSLQLIETDHPEVKDFRFWNQTMKDIRNLRLLIDELSSFQKGNLLNITKINLFDFTEDLLESTESYLVETGTPLTLECPIDDLDFYADSVKLRQAIVNLLKNAAESSKEGSPIILSITPAEKSFLHISVSDNGCGMTEEEIAKAFEPFHTTKASGTGLGLPIVKKIVEAHKGTLSVHSCKGKGTTITIRLPLS